MTKWTIGTLQVFLFLLCLQFWLPELALAHSATAPLLHVDIASDAAGIESGAFSSRLIQMIGLLTVLSLAPSIVMMVTSFTRIVVVFSILRNGLGLQQTPPNVVLTSLAMFLTYFIMQPAMQRAYDEGIKPMIEREISEERAWERMVDPFHEFMFQNTSQKELAMFMGMAGLQDVALNSRDHVPLRALMPAFMISELKKAFQIGFLLFLPFMVIDILVAAILMAMGMMMLPPAMLALPIKIIFFVMVDGWYLICGSLVKSYGL